MSPIVLWTAIGVSGLLIGLAVIGLVLKAVTQISVDEDFDERERE